MRSYRKARICSFKQIIGAIICGLGAIWWSVQVIIDEMIQHYIDKQEG